MTNTTVIGLFRDHTEAQAAIHDLENDGFLRKDISLVARDGAVDPAGHDVELGSGTAKGAAIGGAAGAMLGLAALAIPGIGPILALGPLAAALTGAGVGAATGSMVGALSDMGVPEHESHFYEASLREGGSLVVVHAGVDTAERAQSVLDRHGALGVEEDRTLAVRNETEENFGDEGGSSQWSHTALTASEKRSNARAYPDSRKPG
jgi:uncharacterized membrane protein